MAQTLVPGQCRRLGQNNLCRTHGWIDRNHRIKQDWRYGWMKSWKTIAWKLHSCKLAQRQANIGKHLFEGRGGSKAIGQSPCMETTYFKNGLPKPWRWASELKWEFWCGYYSSSWYCWYFFLMVITKRSLKKWDFNQFLSFPRWHWFLSRSAMKDLINDYQPDHTTTILMAMMLVMMRKRTRSTGCPKKNWLI